METMEVISSDKASVVIQVNPQVEQDSVIFIDGQKARGSSHNAALKGLFKAQPKSLGIAQIITGVVIFIIGVIFTFDDYNYSAILVYSGITYWGSIIYISAGILSVAAQNNLHPCIVKASLGMNVFSAITAGLAILLMSVLMFIYAKMLWIIGLVLSILQFIISIYISGFGCKTSSNTDSTVINVTLS